MTCIARQDVTHFDNAGDARRERNVDSRDCGTDADVAGSTHGGLGGE